MKALAVALLCLVLSACGGNPYRDKEGSSALVTPEADKANIIVDARLLVKSESFKQKLAGPVDDQVVAHYNALLKHDRQCVINQGALIDWVTKTFPQEKK